MPVTAVWMFVFLFSSGGLLADTKNQPLGTIRKLSYRLLSPGAVEIRWRDPAMKGRQEGKPHNNGGVYAIEYGTSDGAMNHRTVLTPVKRHVINDMTPGRTYDVRVRWVNGFEAGPWTKDMKVQVPGHKATKPYNNPIHNLTATPLSAKSIRLSWQRTSHAHQPMESVSLIGGPANTNKRQIRATLTSVTSSHTVTGLAPNTMYVFVLTPVLRDKSLRVKGPKVKVKTWTSRPSRPPRVTKTTVLNDTAAEIRWAAPPLRRRNGHLTGYKIGVRGQGQKTAQAIHVGKSLRSYVMTGLQAHKAYRVRIAATNINGTGPYSKWTFFKPTPLHGVTEGGVENVEGAGKISTTTEMTSSLQNKSEGTSSESPSTEGTDPASPPPVDDLQVLATSPTRVHLLWTPPREDPCCPVLAWRLSLTNLNDSKLYDFVKGSTNVTVDDLDPDTSYSAKVTSYTTQGKSLPSEEIVFHTTPVSAPPVIIDLNSSKVVKGGNVNMTCKVKGHQGTVEFTWKVGNVTLQEPLSDQATLSEKADRVVMTSSTLSEDTITSSLLLYNVTSSAEANYTCLAKNRIGSDERNVALVVTVPPTIVTIRGTSVTVGDTAQLMCLAQGNPVPDIAWEHPFTGSVYSQNTSRNRTSRVQVRTHLEGIHRRRSYLSVSDTEFKHGGLYTCRVRNEAGRKQLNVTINIQVPPPPHVDSLRAVPTSPTRVSMSWRPPKDYVHPILYYEVRFKSSQGEVTSIIQTRRPGIELSNLVPDTQYGIEVVAGTLSGLGDTGSRVNVTTLTNVGLEPVNVTITVVNFTTIQITWSPPSAVPAMFIRGYRIGRRSEGNPRERSVFLDGGKTRKHVMVLPRKDTYFVTVATVTTWGLEAASGWMKMPLYSAEYLPPNPARDVITTANLREIIVKWSPPLSRTSGSKLPGDKFIGFYFSHHQLHHQDNVTEVLLPPNATSYVMEHLDPSTVYVVTLLAYNEYGNSDPVYIYPTTTSLPPSMVQDVKASPLSSTKIHIRWKPPKRGQVTRYHIRYWRPGRKGKQSAWVSGKLNNYVAGSLRKDRTYRFELIPYDVDRPGESVIIFASTLEDKPDGPPITVMLTAVNATTLVGSWSPPRQDKTNGKITGYRLILRKKNGPRVANFVLGADKHNFTFLNMQTSSTHTLRVAAINANGTGVFSPAVMTSYTQDPQIPAKPEGVTVNTTDSSLLLQWAEPKFTGSPVFGYVVGYGQFIPDVFRRVVSGGQRSYIVSKLKPDSEYIVSVRAFNAIGESVPVYRLARTMKGPTVSRPVLQPTNVKAVAESMTSLNVSWTDPSMTPGDPQGVSDGRIYQVRFSSIDGEAYSYTNSTKTSVLLTGLEPSTLYELSVRAMRGRDVSKWTLAVVNSTRLIPPRSAPINIKARPVEGSPSYLELTWSAPVKGGGGAEDYVIHLTSDPSLPPFQWVVLTTHRTQATIRELTPKTIYYIKLQARNSKGYGPLSPTIVYRPVMGLETKHVDNSPDESRIEGNFTDQEPRMDGVNDDVSQTESNRRGNEGFNDDFDNGVDGHNDDYDDDNDDDNDEDGYGDDDDADDDDDDEERDKDDEMIQNNDKKRNREREVKMNKKMRKGRKQRKWMQAGLKGRKNKEKLAKNKKPVDVKADGSLGIKTTTTATTSTSTTSSITTAVPNDSQYDMDVDGGDNRMLNNKDRNNSTGDMNNNMSDSNATEIELDKYMI